MSNTTTHRVTMKEWPLEELLAKRNAVLSRWPSGAALRDLEESFAYRRTLPDTKNMPALIRRAESTGQSLVTPRAGVATVEEFTMLLQALEEAGADFLPATIDSLSRHHRYAEVTALIEESKSKGRSMLNGTPIINWGVQAVRRFNEAVREPILTYYAAFDGRFLAEMTLGGGLAGIVSSPMVDLLCYNRDDSVSELISNWQYVERLTALYEAQGFEIHRGMPSYPIGSVIPPSTSVVATCIDAMISASQGAKNVNLLTRHVGSALQDVAGIHAQERVARKYCALIGRADVKITSEFNQYVGEFPLDEAEAVALISAGAIIGLLGGAVLINVKTPDEGWGLPTVEGNVRGTKIVKFLAELFRNQRYPSSPELDEEEAMIEEEACTMLDATLDLGDGDLAVGLPRALEAGVVDFPYSPARVVHGSCIAARDVTGAVRWVDPGQIPFSKKVRDFNRDQLAQRSLREGRDIGYEMALDDAEAGIRNVAGRDIAASALQRVR